MGDSSSDRDPRNKSELKLVILSHFIDKRIARPFESATQREVQSWVPDHEESIALRALMDLVAEDGPIKPANKPGRYWLEDITDAQKRREELELDYPHWFTNEA